MTDPLRWVVIIIKSFIIIQDHRRTAVLYVAIAGMPSLASFVPDAAASDIERTYDLASISRLSPWP